MAVTFQLLFVLSVVLVSVRCILDRTCNSPERHRKAYHHHVDGTQDVRRGSVMAVLNWA